MPLTMRMNGDQEGRAGKLVLNFKRGSARSSWRVMRGVEHMKTDEEALQLINECFGSLEKPEHFTDYRHCEECFEHDETLRAREVSTLSIEDVGNICWQPISFCSPEGIAYYMPALARLALAPPTYEYGWYGETLEIHLSFYDGKNNFYDHCTEKQRKAISSFLKYLEASRGHLLVVEEHREEFKALAEQWAR